MNSRENTNGKFKLKRRTRFDEIGENHELPESDLTFQNDTTIYQFEYVEPKDEKKVEIEPGTFMMAENSSGLVLKKLEFKKRTLLESTTTTSTIMKEAKTFFSKLDTYKRLNRIEKRGVLVYSSPGMGKTATIEKVCENLTAEDPGTIVMVWPTASIEADSITRFLGFRSEYKKECTRVILIIEDIGGVEKEFGERNPVDAGLLNLLDGVGNIFKLPTFIIATTNHPEKLLSSLADRPGRFDLMLKLTPPKNDEKIALLKFMSGRDLTKEEEEAICKRGTEHFSVAHLEEVVMRSLLHDKSYNAVIDELIAHHEAFKKDFDDKNSIGMGIG